MMVKLELVIVIYALFSQSENACKITCKFAYKIRVVFYTLFGCLEDVKALKGAAI